jgi:hypothetical protein
LSIRVRSRRNQAAPCVDRGPRTRYAGRSADLPGGVLDVADADSTEGSVPDGSPRAGQPASARRCAGSGCRAGALWRRVRAAGSCSAGRPRRTRRRSTGDPVPGAVGEHD